MIIKAQAAIAFVNAVLTTLGMLIIGYLHGNGYPYVLTLGLIVFLAGFIPVLGTFISSVPIIIVGYSAFGASLGFAIVIEIVLLITFIHLVETYLLNPKIVSRYLKLPISMTFVVLILSEYLFGIAGLLIGVSLFYFIVSLLVDVDKQIQNKKNKGN